MSLVLLGVDWLNPSAFEWQPGVTGLSTPQDVMMACVAYWVGILALKYIREFIPDQYVNVKALAAVHNAILCIWSLVMALGIAWSMLRRVLGEDSACRGPHCSGPTSLMCVAGQPDSRGDMYYWMYMYYLSKYYELIDTVFIVLNKKKLIFLHWYHHSIVLVICFVWMQYELNIGSFGMLANTIVHVFMYAYYTMSALKIDVWFKKYITIMQIIQFAINFVVAATFVFLHQTGVCTRRDDWAFEFSIFCNATFLVLFLDFFKKSYRKGGRGKANTEGGDGGDTIGPKKEL